MPQRPLPKYVVDEPNLAMIRAIGRPRTVLDAGCGSGLNGAAARAAGARVVGVDTDAASLAHARELLDEVVALDIESADLERAFPERRFDLILAGDVLEHTREPQKVLAALAALLEDCGRVILSVPNVAAWPVRLGLLAGRFEYEPSGILDDTHLRFFTQASLMRMVEGAGLQPLSVDLNPFLVRAARTPVRAVLLATQKGDVDPGRLRRSALYQAYSRYVRPTEDRIAKLAPGLLAFQHVLVARKPPVPRTLSLTVGMLTYNERDSICDMIDDIKAVAPDASILIVDSSTDDTPELARARGAEVVRQLPAQGHGPAMERLMVEAARRSDALIYLDCDRTYPVQEIPRLRALLEQGADVVNASRTHRKPRAMPWPNYAANRIFASAVRVVHGLPTTDVHSGMRGYRCSVLRDFAFDGSGDALPVDTIVLPARLGYKVVELPIEYHDRVGDSKLRKLSGTTWTFVRIARALGTGSRKNVKRSYSVESA